MVYALVKNQLMCPIFSKQLKYMYMTIYISIFNKASKTSGNTTLN